MILVSDSPPPPATILGFHYIHYICTMSFRYVRGALHNILPDETTLRRWMTKIDASPGFTAQALDHIKNHVEREKEAGRNVFCSLILDEMNIKKNVYFDGKVRYSNFTVNSILKEL